MAADDVSTTRQHRETQNATDHLSVRFAAQCLTSVCSPSSSSSLAEQQEHSIGSISPCIGKRKYGSLKPILEDESPVLSDDADDDDTFGVSIGAIGTHTRHMNIQVGRDSSLTGAAPLPKKQRKANFVSPRRSTHVTHAYTTLTFDADEMVFW